MIHFDILTLFPEMFEGVFGTSIINRARENDYIKIELHNIRDYAPGRHRVTDDTPYGGGGGMVMKPEPIFNAVEAILAVEIPAEGYQVLQRQGYPPVVLLTPQGRLLNQPIAHEFVATFERLLLICGRYEGVDERVRQYLATDEISIGDYVLSGGEVAAMVYASGSFSRLPHPGDTAIGPPRQARKLAPSAVFGSYPAPPPGSASRSRAYGC
jgi:tRNA (guanine37-N1)-methyltransferase